MGGTTLHAQSIVTREKKNKKTTNATNNKLQQQQLINLKTKIDSNIPVN